MLMMIVRTCEVCHVFFLGLRVPTDKNGGGKKRKENAMSNGVNPHTDYLWPFASILQDVLGTEGQLQLDFIS